MSLGASAERREKREEIRCTQVDVRYKSDAVRETREARHEIGAERTHNTAERSENSEAGPDEIAERKRGEILDATGRDRR